MQTLFELKTKIAPDPTVARRLREKAIELLSDTEKGQYTQAIVLHSATGQEYGTVIQNALSEEKTEETVFLREIRETKDSEIRFALCMWQDFGIDIPSFAFRKLLLDINDKNSEATLLVMTEDGIGGIKLSTTMK